MFLNGDCKRICVIVAMKSDNTVRGKLQLLIYL